MGGPDTVYRLRAARASLGAGIAKKRKPLIKTRNINSFATAAITTDVAVPGRYDDRKHIWQAIMAPPRAQRPVRICCRRGILVLPATK